MVKVVEIGLLDKQTCIVLLIVAYTLLIVISKNHRDAMTKKALTNRASRTRTYAYAFALHCTHMRIGTYAHKSSKQIGGNFATLQARFSFWMTSVEDRESWASLS